LPQPTPVVDQVARRAVHQDPGHRQNHQGPFFPLAGKNSELGSLSDGPRCQASGVAKESCHCIQELAGRSAPC
jgi:hypothetical protein